MKRASIFDIYTQWRRDIRRYLDSKIAHALVASEVERIQRSRRGRSSRNEELARGGMDGGLLGRHGIADIAGRITRRFEALDDLRERWRTLHDSDVDFIMGLMDIVIRMLGEESLGDMYENWVVGDWFNTRYARFDLSKTSWDEAFRLIVYLTFESMHGHLSGPQRDGSVSFAEFDDR